MKFETVESEHQEEGSVEDPKKVSPKVSPRASAPKFDDTECMVICKMYDSNVSRWKGKSDTWAILLNQFYKKNKMYIEKGRKLLEELN